MLSINEQDQARDFSTGPDSNSPQFVGVLMREDQEGFARLMADQICWVADGGGKASAATHTVRGKRATSRLAMGLVRRWQGRWKTTVEILNGQPGTITWREGNVQVAMALG